VKLDRYGIALDVPAGWEARIYRRPATPPEQTFPVLHAGNFPLPVERGDFGSGAVQRMAPDNVLVVLFEYAPAATQTPLFAQRGLPRLHPESFSPRQLQRTLPGQSGQQAFFTWRGRAFCLYVVLGSHARRAALVPAVARLLTGLTVAPRAVS
jgi:hypothetical protein